MLTNMQSLYLSGIVIIGFFIAGLFHLLDHFIVQIVLGLLFVLIIVNLFIAKPLPEDVEEPNINNDNL